MDYEPAPDFDANFLKLVIVYRIKGDKVQLLYVDHHGSVYERSAEILEEIEQEEES
jgi:hypothetical protein